MTTEKKLLKRLHKIEAAIKALHAEKSAIYRKAKEKEISVEQLKAELYKDRSPLKQ